MSINKIQGKTLTRIEVDKTEKENRIVFECSDGEQFLMFHRSDCCEDVFIDDINGDMNDLLHSPITLAEESVSDDENSNGKSDYDESWTWTFYKLATVKGYVDIKWYGTSNGYYSESVDFESYTP